MNKIAAVVVTYNRKCCLINCLNAIRLQTLPPDIIYIIDNHSTDGTDDILLNNGYIFTPPPPPLNNTNENKDTIISYHIDSLGKTKVSISIRYIYKSENTGGAGGFFTGMKYIAENDYKYCWLMDDDVVCMETALEELMNAMKLNSDMGFVCSKVVGIDGLPMNVPAIDERPTHNGYPNWFDKIEHQLIKIRTATFVSILLPTDHIRKLGLPYKEFFIWGDDTEYTKRISTKYDSYLVCKSLVIHKRMQQSSLSFFTEKDKVRLKMYFYYFRNNSFVYNQDASILQKVRHNCYFVIIFMKMVFTFDFIKAFIILKSRMALLTFHPKIQYPGTNRKNNQ